METLVSEDSPLAAYLDGKDESEALTQAAYESRTDHLEVTARTRSPPPSFAPRGLPTILTRIPQSRLYRKIHNKPVACLRSWYGSLVASTLGSADNARFLEHFRYILIASQLLNEQVAPGNPRTNLAPFSSESQYRSATASLIGAVLSATLSFALVWAINWTRADPRRGFSKSRLLLVVFCSSLAILLLYGYLRRQWLQHLRRQVVATASDFVSEAQNFEATTTSTLTLIQEVELVSRGYRISTPLPPVSRLENSSQVRRCLRLRRKVRAAYCSTVPAFQGAARSLRAHADADDLERFLDAYDLQQQDVYDALELSDDQQVGDGESLRDLRAQQAQLSTLRRLVICSLLSIPATGRQLDAIRWRVCVQEMEKLCNVMNQSSECIAKLLRDDDQIPTFPVPTSASKASAPNTPTQAQTRRISALTGGIRSIQAKLYLFREDSARVLSSSNSETDLLTLSGTLRDQYDAIGADLRALMHAWETGRQALVEDISKQERRVSRASSSLRSSAPSIGGLTIVGEDEDAPDTISPMSPRTSALRKLTGEADRPLTPPVTESEDEGSKDENVFEAVAMPTEPLRARSTLTREQRIAKMHEERERLAVLKEKREAKTNMIRELQTVIHLRPSARRNTIDGNLAAGMADSV